MYRPPRESVTQHPLPGVFEEARYGIFIDLTISTVPAYAPPGLGDINHILQKKNEAYKKQSSYNFHWTKSPKIYGTTLSMLVTPPSLEYWGG